MCEANKIETQICGRCGGCGNYSYCQMYGTTCFQCGGRGKVLSRRGKAALMYLRDLRSKSAKDLAVGDVILTTGVTGGTQVYQQWAVIEAIKPAICPELAGTMRIETTKCTIEGWGPDQRVEVRGCPEWRNATYAKAMEFQKTLARNGKPRVKGRTDAEQDALNAAAADKRRASKQAKLAQWKVERDTAEREANGGLTDREVREQERAAEAAEVAQRALEAAEANKWLIEVLQRVPSGGTFIPAMIEKLGSARVLDLSEKCVNILRDIYAKNVGGRKGSKAFDAACDLFDERIGMVKV